MVTEAIDLTGYDDWQLELLDKLRIKMLRFAGPASMFFALPMTQEEIPSELHGYLDSLAAEVLPYFCNEASPTNSLPGPFYHLKPVLHHNTFSEIKKLQLEADAQRAATQESNDLKAMSTKPIFISHASKDEAIVDHFVDSFLCLGLEVTHKDIFCSTLEGMKIITGDEWRHSILDALKGCKVVFALISPNYLASEMCLVELGAAWALPDITVLPVIIPPLEPGKSTVLLNPNQSMRIDHAGNLDQLRVDACKALNIEENVHVGRWNKKKDQFLTRVKELLELSGKK
ncbi:MAG: toll/interleukin-1 receptor domain-containing protein [Bacteroidetes bacterium]|nr:toll/interleukin-1 receptor domain-containing protein [Bacteroidota bacterium]MBL0017613.1 toll/interleukin-1 receptor domain-containing protein [Bacteroidota bacterium]